MSSYKVLAPYVTARVKDLSGQEVLLGYYQDGVIEDPVDSEHLKGLLDLGMVEKVKASQSPKQDTPKQDQPPADQPPAGNASRDDWAAYAATKGAPADETKSVEEGGLKQTELRDKYGK